MSASDRSWLDTDAIPLRAHWQTLLSRRKTVLQVALSVTAVALLLSVTQQPTYRASTTLQIEPDAPKVLDFESLLQVDATNDAFYQTQYRLIESRSLAQRVITSEGLLETGSEPNTSVLAPASAVVRWVAGVPSAMVGLIRGIVGTSPPNIEPDQIPIELFDERYTEAIDVFLAELEVNPVRNTRLVRISWHSKDPIQAAAITNAVARAYIDTNLEAKFETTEQAGQFLTTEIDRLRDDIAGAEASLQQFGNERDIISSDERQDTVTQALADLSAESTRAQTDRIQKQSYVEQLRESQPSSIPEVFGNSLVQRLKTDHAELQQQYSQMSRTFTDDWPEMRSLRSQMGELDTRIAEEEQRIFDSLVRNATNQYEAAVDQEDTIMSLLEQRRTDAMELNRNLSSYRAIQLEIDSNKALLESLLERQSETGVSARLQGMRTSNIRVVDPAVIPRGPFRPSVRRNVLFGAMLGLFLGLATAFFMEYMDNTLKTPEDVEMRTGLPNLGLIPSLASASRNRMGKYGYVAYGYGDSDYTEAMPDVQQPELVTAEHPRSALAEAYRNLRTSVLLSSAGQPPEIVIVTSSVPGEGKTTSSINLAVSMAQVGKKVLIVDADLRKPRLHNVFSLDASRGLVHYLTGSSNSLKEVIQKTEIDNLWALPCGPKPPNPAELLSSPRTQATFESLRTAFDVVIVDSPPVLAVVDALVVLPWTDGVVMVVKGGDTPYPVVERARKKITEVGGKILGVNLNNVEFEHLRYVSYRGRQEAPPGVGASTSNSKTPRRIA